MPDITVSIDRPHAIAMHNHALRQQITDAELRGLLPRLTGDVTLRIVRRHCNTVIAKAFGIIPRTA